MSIKRQEKNQDDDLINQAIGARLKEFRIHKNMTQREFAKGLNNFDRGNLSKIENGERYVDAKLLYHLLSKYKNFSLEWLIMGEGEMEDGN